MRGLKSHARVRFLLGLATPPRMFRVSARCRCGALKMGVLDARVDSKPTPEASDDCFTRSSRPSRGRTVDFRALVSREQLRKGSHSRFAQRFPESDRRGWLFPENER